MYRPLQVSGNPKSSVIGSMPVRGQNNKDNPQFLDPTSALYILNYYADGLGKLTKRKGTLLDVNTDTPLKDVWMEWDDTYDIVAYDQYIKLYNRTTDTFTTLKSDMTSTETHEGAAAGAYAFVTNKTDGLQRIKYEIEVDYSTAYSGNNVVSFGFDSAAAITDNYIIGATSGAVGVIVGSVADANSDNVIVVFTVTSGTFDQYEDLRIEYNSVDTTLTPSSLINQFSYYSNLSPVPSSTASAIGQKVTGQTSGATAEIVYQKNFADTRGQAGNRPENKFTLKNVVGTFIPGETIIGDKEVGNYLSLGSFDLYGRAKIVSAGVVVDSLYNDENANQVPKAGGVSVNGNRIFIYNLTDDSSATAYSSIPFADSTTGWVSTEVGGNFRDSALFTQGGLVSYAQAGAARSNAQIGDILVTFCDNGWYAWTIDAVSTTTTVSKSNNIVASRIDAGGARGAIVTPIGLCVANEAGVTAIYGLGLTNVPYSKQAKLITDSLGEEFFEDVSFANCSMAYDERRQVVYVACAKNSSNNNLVLVIRAESGTGSSTGAQGAVTLFDWPVHRFLKRSDGTLYATTTDGDLYLLDTGSDDNTFPIHTEYLQELNFGLIDLFNLEEWYWKGELSNASSINVSFDTFDKDMYYRENVDDYTWVPRNSYSTPTGWGVTGWGKAGFGSGSSTGMVEDLNGAKPKLRNLSRVRIRFTSDDYAPHTINWMSGSVSPVRQNRKRTLSNS